MKNKQKTLLLTALIALISQSLFAYSFEVNGIYYNVLSSLDKTVEVTYKSATWSSNYRYICEKHYEGDVTIPDKVTYSGIEFSVVSIGASAFSDSELLFHVDIPQSVKTICDFAFCACPNMNSITIPNTVDSIGNNVFDEDYGLRELIIEDGESVLKIGYHSRIYSSDSYYSLFSNCQLEFVYVGRCWEAPQSYKDLFENSRSAIINLGPKLTKIPDYCFCNNTSLYEISIPESVTAIGSYAFSGCTNLKKLIIPKNVTELGDDPFPVPCDGFYLCFTSTDVPAFSHINYSTSRIYNICVPGVSIDSYIKRLKSYSVKYSYSSSTFTYTNKIYPIVDIPLFERQTVQSFENNLSGVDRSQITSIGFYGGIENDLTEQIAKNGVNHNCLFLVSSSTGLQWDNVIYHDTNKAKKVILDKSNPFDLSCCSFFADEIECRYQPSRWANGTNGWETIVLPFSPISIEASSSGYINPIQQTGKGNFWLRQYVGSNNDAVLFSSTSDGVMKANTPYLIAFPGDKMGKGSLEGQTITFKAKNVTVPVTEIPSIQKNGYTFVGNYDKTADEGGGWTLNAEGSAFVWSETVGDKPFSGYFKGEAPTASSAALRMSFGQMDNTTGLEQNMAELIDYADEAVYTLDGRKVITKDLKPGLYIKNNKKMMVR